jgi:hypothetical protein
MRKFVGVACLVLGIAAVPNVAAAGPIGTNACTVNSSGLAECDIFADFTGNGASILGLDEGNLGSYLLGYTFLLNQTANLSDGFQEEDVAHILVIHDSIFELFSNTAFNLAFGDIFDAASIGAAIDGLSPSIGQLAGCPPAPSGVPSLSGVGFCNTADIVTVLVNWGIGQDGGQDVLRINTGFAPEDPTDPPDPTPVPEPGTLSLFVLGGSAALASIRRRRREQSAKS